MPNGIDQLVLRTKAQECLIDAQVLLKASRFSGSLYLAGYAVELALKAVICKLLQVGSYPPVSAPAFKTHDLNDLRTLAGLSSEINAQATPDLFRNWSIAVNWNPEQRYDARAWTQSEAEEMIRCLTEPTNGVFVWLSQRW